METSTNKYLKWNDPEYKSNYYKEYYHKNKVLKNKPRVVEQDGWTKDKEAIKKYYQEKHKRTWNDKKPCEICGQMINERQRMYHDKTKLHLNAIAVRKMVALTQEQLNA